MNWTKLASRCHLEFISGSRNKILTFVRTRFGMTLLLIGAILLLAAFFRLYQLNQVPPSPSLDEVSIGWNAYSLLETGKDEYGYRLPVLLRAYDDWRPALYVYFVIPFVKFFGLSAATVRLPAVLLSLVTILATYFLVEELFARKRSRIEPWRWLPFIACFLLAISPWHIYISRLGHEVGAGLTFSILGLLFFLKWRLALSAVFFALSLYTYQSQKVFIPLLLVSLAWIYKDKILKRKKQVFSAALLGLILLVPLIEATLAPGGLARFQGSSILSDLPEVYHQASIRMARNYEKGNFLGLLFDNRQVALGIYFLRSYFSHFDPSWLFFNQGQERHKIPGLGHFYLWVLPLILVGAYQLAKGKFSRKTKWLILSWLLVAPLPAAIATQTPHGMRAFNLLPMPQILAAMGIAVVVSSVKRQASSKIKRYLIFVFCFFFLIFNLLYLYHNYFINFPYEQSESFQYPLNQAAKYVAKIEDQYQKIVFSNQSHCYQSYMFFLFASKYSPSQYLAQGGTISGGFAQIHAFDKYEFRPIDWGKERKEKGTLFVGNVDDFLKGIGSLATFNLLNGKEAIKIVAIN